MKARRWANAWGIGAAMLVPALAVGALTIPYSFSDGSVISATEMNANFDAVAVEVGSIDGRVAALESTKTLYHVLQAADFLPNKADNSPPNAHVINNLLAVQRTGTALNTNPVITNAVAPIHLPQGATIKSFTCSVLDDDANSAIQVDLIVDGWDTPDYNVVDGITTNATADDAAYRPLTATLTVPLVVDNQASRYRFSAQLSIPNNDASPSNAFLALAGCRIEYDLAGG